MKKEKIVLTILFILFILFGFQYYKNLNSPKSIKLNQYITSITKKNSASQSPQPPEQPFFNDSKTKYLYKDQNIIFEYPLIWKADYGRQFNNPYVINVDFVGQCNVYRVASFAYKTTDINNPESFLLGQKNPNGPENQTSKIIKVKGVTMGENIQPEGDGSGGYEPKAVIDFLSKSRKYHYYFIAVLGCRNSFEETYRIDLLPILISVKLLD